MLIAPEEQEKLIIYCSIQGSGERRTNDGKRSQADANLLCQPGAKGPGSKLHRYGKIGASISTCKQKAKKILLSSPYHSNNRLTHKKHTIKPRSREDQGDGQDDSQRKRASLARSSHRLRFSFEELNNKVEYEALIAGLRIAEKIGVQNLQVNVDSKLVANQVNRTYTAKETDMIKYLEKVKALASTFQALSIKQVSRSKNKKADALSKMASISFAHLNKQVLVEELKEKSMNESEVLIVVEEEGDSWMTPIHEYLTDEILLAKRKKARAIKRPSQANYVLREIHEGSCSMHAGTRSVVAKALRIGYYWPTMHEDARALIRACQECQVHKPVLRNPFGLLGEIISDNGKQFRDNPFKDWCEKLCIQQHFVSVKHPQINGLVERANRSLGEGIKARLGKDNKNWIEEISHVLWAHRIMIKTSNGDTLFSLTYGTEVVIPAEIGMPTFKTAKVDMEKNDEALQINLELLEEKREQAAIAEAKSKRQMEKYYNAKVRNTRFKPGDFVYRSNEASRAEDTGKLGPKWKGPYEVTEALGKGSYRLKDRNGKVLPRAWNVCNLKKCYIHKM
ncbi:reverse transcriptase domain-containing protein [Tanacetum coccineum]